MTFPLSRSYWPCFLILLLPFYAPSQPSQSFELRYFSPDKAASAEMGFKGKTAVFSTFYEYLNQRK